jgi:hypothetical protein
MSVCIENCSVSGNECMYVWKIVWLVAMSVFEKCSVSGNECMY